MGGSVPLNKDALGGGGGGGGVFAAGPAGEILREVVEGAGVSGHCFYDVDGGFIVAGCCFGLLAEDYEVDGLAKRQGYFCLGRQYGLDGLGVVEDQAETLLEDEVSQSLGKNAEKLIVLMGNVIYLLLQFRLTCVIL